MNWGYSLENTAGVLTELGVLQGVLAALHWGYSLHWGYCRGTHCIALGVLKWEYCKGYCPGTHVM